jgi:benzoyl-CoA reductase subunit C
MWRKIVEKTKNNGLERAAKEEETMGDNSSRKGLALAQDISRNRQERAKLLKAQGRKIVGYICPLIPPELMTASKVVPYLIVGEPTEPIVKADVYMETNLCPWVRNCFDQALKGRYQWLDGVIMAHSCDAVQRMYGLWCYYCKPAYHSFVNVPHSVTPATRRFYKEELVMLREGLGGLVNAQISDESLRQAIVLHNKLKSEVKKLYSLRKQDIPLVSGTEMAYLLTAISSIPVGEALSLVQDVHDEVVARGVTGNLSGKRSRVLVYGSIIDAPAFIELIEQSGVNIVIDDTCIGSRNFWNEVAYTTDPMDGLVATYFDQFRCPRMMRTSDPGRFDYLVDMAREFRVDGVIFHCMRFCDCNMFEVPDVRDRLSAAGISVLYLEDDYTMGSKARLKTRIQAFAEQISQQY